MNQKVITVFIGEDQKIYDLDAEIEGYLREGWVIQQVSSARAARDSGKSIAVTILLGK